MKANGITDSDLEMDLMLEAGIDPWDAEEWGMEPRQESAALLLEELLAANDQFGFPYGH